MKWVENQEYYYEDEPIRLTAERAGSLPPKEYRKMWELAFGSPFSRNNDAKIFYLQARYMEHFEDDCPYEREVLHYFPTYQSLSMAELRGYFTWRTRLRHGKLEKTSLSYAYLYIYELLHQIGSETKEEGLEALLWFYEQYGELDPGIRHYTERWIADYAIYYDLPAELVKDYVNADFDAALVALRDCDTVDDETLFPAIMRLSSYHLERSKAFKKYPEELSQVLCGAYRRLNARYAGRYGRPYSQKLFGNPARVPYTPFRSAVFFGHERHAHYEYRVSPVQCYLCERNRWSLERGYFSSQRDRTLGVFVRAADRLVREAYGVKPPLKVGTETKTMIRFISEAIEEQKKNAAPKVEFDLSKLSGIRRSSDAVGQRLMTEEERYVEAEPPTLQAQNDAASSSSKAQVQAEPASGQPGMQAQEGSASLTCILSGNELRFAQILLYGGDLQEFLLENHLMASVLAEAVNEQLYDEFADTVIEFDGNTPVLVEDYRDDLKGMIPS
ncbi:MAG: TerB N-terminal domain-containing protein [Lachnospiraceae bacterium]|nr:TerB N-terminal domain-containing protein [Lachnospiraceae bacterium]